MTPVEFLNWSTVILQVYRLYLDSHRYCFWWIFICLYTVTGFPYSHSKPLCYATHHKRNQRKTLPDVSGRRTELETNLMNDPENKDRFWAPLFATLSNRRSHWILLHSARVLSGSFEEGRTAENSRMNGIIEFSTRLCRVERVNKYRSATNKYVNSGLWTLRYIVYRRYY